MKLSKYKEKNKINVVELADKFGVSHQIMYQWIKNDNAKITGKIGERVITVNHERTIKELTDVER